MFKILILLILLFIVNTLSLAKTIDIDTVETLASLKNKQYKKGKLVEVKSTLNGGIFIFDPNKININDGGIIFSGWVRKEFLDNPKILKLKWFLSKKAGESGEPDKEKDLDHTEALLNFFKKIDHGMSVYIPNGVFYSKKRLSCKGKHYVNFIGEGYALQQNSHYASNSRLQYRGLGKNTIFIDAGKHPSFKNIAIWGNGSSKDWKANHLHNTKGTIGIKIEGSLNAINLQLKYHKTALYFWKDSYYTRTYGLEIKYTDLAFSYKQVPYNQKHFGAIFQETSKLWDKSGRAFSFIGCSFEHYSITNIIYPGTKVTFSNCYFETKEEVSTVFKLEKRASLAFRDSTIYTKNSRYFVDNSHGYYSVYISENNFIVNDQKRDSTYTKLSPDNKGQIIKMFGDILEINHPKNIHYIDREPFANSANIVLPRGTDIYLDNGNKIDSTMRYRIN
jgi:hypothetical protein